MQRTDRLYIHHMLKMACSEVAARLRFNRLGKARLVKGLFQFIIIALLPLATGCLIVGGGIAGAGADPIWRVQSAKNYDEYKSEKIRVALNPNPEAEPPEWYFDDVMRNFAASVERVDSDFTAIPDTDFQARFNHSDQKLFELRDSNATIIIERLPKVFCMHPLQLGTGTVANTNVVMILNRSRATTGLYFVGLFTLQGEPLYKAVLKPYEVRDIHVTKDTIEILGECETRKITFSN